MYWKKYKEYKQVIGNRSLVKHLRYSFTLSYLSKPLPKHIKEDLYDIFMLSLAIDDNVDESLNTTSQILQILNKKSPEMQKVIMLAWNIMKRKPDSLSDCAVQCVFHSSGVFEYYVYLRYPETYDKLKDFFVKTRNVALIANLIDHYIDDDVGADAIFHYIPKKHFWPVFRELAQSFVWWEKLYLYLYLGTVLIQKNMFGKVSI